MRTLMFVALAACSGVQAPVDDEASWGVDATVDGALLGVWGHAPDDVWAVGGQLDRPLVMHNDGTGWARRAVPGGSLLWNVYGFTDSDVYAVGERGLILHYDGNGWTQVESGTDETLFGLWGASGDDVWIVGGDATGERGTAVILRGSGGSFQPVADIPPELRPDTVFKVHGFAATDVIMVGTDGVLRWNGSEWRRDEVPTTGPLLAAWGRGADDVYAVGGRDVAHIVRYDGRAWRLVAELPIGSSLSGVFTTRDGPTIAVGARSFLFEVSPDGHVAQPALPDMTGAPDLHAVWGDDAGTSYAVGANLRAYPDSMRGIILSRR